MTQESVSVAARQPTLAATTAAVSALVAANPAFAGDLFGPEYAGAVTGAGAVVLLGTARVVVIGVFGLQVSASRIEKLVG